MIPRGNTREKKRENQKKPIISACFSDKL